MADVVKRLAVLGSTGSIGRQTLDVVRAHPERFHIVALAAGRNIDILAGQIREFKPKFVSYLSSGENNENTQSWLGDAGCQFLSLEDMAGHPDVDTVVIATSGTAGLKATMAAVKAGKNVALANKESLVAAGELVMGAARQSGARILPVDSEHSAIWQCLNGEGQAARSIILTASGGPFRDYAMEQMRDVTVEQALTHPSWHMGKKVTIDSATLMNKGLEVIEAHWLFNIPIDDISVLIHPQSIIHSMVEFIDGSVKAQLSYPDMRLPIQ
jgi:1-deoxy-D-xylulose-5-phosphate reductoisomerase